MKSMVYHLEDCTSWCECLARGKLEGELEVLIKKVYCFEEVYYVYESVSERNDPIITHLYWLKILLEIAKTSVPIMNSYRIFIAGFNEIKTTNIKIKKLAYRYKRKTIKLKDTQDNRYNKYSNLLEAAECSIADTELIMFFYIQKIKKSIVRSNIIGEIVTYYFMIIELIAEGVQEAERYRDIAEVKLKSMIYKGFTKFELLTLMNKKKLTDQLSTWNPKVFEISKRYIEELFSTKFSLSLINGEEIDEDTNKNIKIIQEIIPQSNKVSRLLLENLRVVQDGKYPNIGTDYVYTNTKNHGYKIYVWKSKLQDSREVAVKRYIVSGHRLEALKEEAKIMDLLSGKLPIFLDFYDCVESNLENDKVSMDLVMEWCPRTLRDIIVEKRREKKCFLEEQLRGSVEALIEGFCYLEAENICHNDIKPENIFISEKGILKIADFNLSKIFEEQFVSIPTAQNTIKGTTDYMAPEIKEQYIRRKNENVNTARYRHGIIDVYSLGMTFLEMYLLKDIKNFNLPEFKDKVNKKVKKIHYPWLRHILSKMLAFNYKKRPYFYQVKEILDKYQLGSV